MCVFLISPVPIAEPLTSELIDTPVFHNLAPRPIKYRVSVPIPLMALYQIELEPIGLHHLEFHNRTLYLHYILGEADLLTWKHDCQVCETKPAQLLKLQN